MPSAHSEPSGERRRPTGPEPAPPALGSNRHDQVDDAIMRERARTRAWLHDTVLQELEMLAAGAYADEPDPVAMAALAAGAADRLRRVIEGDAPPAAGPLVDEIHALVERERLRGELEVRLRVGKLEPPWAGRDAEPLSDALAEALRNVSKHADATAVDVSCEIAAGVATVIVTDNGRGFDATQIARRGGLRHSIIGRLEHEGGRVSVDSGPGRGTRLVLQLGLGLRLSQTAETI
jgi:signal transduction histidine kinase